MKHILGLFLLLLLLLTANCSSSKNTNPEYIFLITLDTTRADHIDYSLSGNQLTPNLAKLASQGHYFEHAYSLIPITLPSHASIFYSLPPHRLRIYNNGQLQKVPETTVTQLLKEKQYATGAVISLGVLKKDFGLDKGFDRYIENFKPYLWKKRAEEVNEDAFKLIRETLRGARGETGRKFFFWLHYSDPHEPYFPPHEDEGGRFRVSLNDKEVFVSRSTEEPLVNIEIPVKPGKNSLSFETEIPPEVEIFPSCTVEYIKYRDFSLESPESGMEITLPDNWNTKKNRTGINYYSKERNSRIFLFNRSGETIPVKLRFIHSLRVNDGARKAFYREEVKYMDRRLGELFEFLKAKNIYDNAVFIIMGDHGEGLGEYRGYFGHIHFLNQPAVNVPLIIAGKGIKPEGKREEVVSCLNVAPTILDIAGIPKPGFMQGQSLLKPLARTRLLLETYSPEAYFDAFSIIDYPFQLIFYPGRRKEKLEFLNLEKGLRNKTSGVVKKIEKINSREKIRTQMVNDLLKISRILTATKGKVGKVSERHREILKSLGYL